LHLHSGGQIPAPFSTNLWLIFAELLPQNCGHPATDSWTVILTADKWHHRQDTEALEHGELPSGHPPNGQMDSWTGGHMDRASL